MPRFGKALLWILALTLSSSLIYLFIYDGIVGKWDLYEIELTTTNKYPNPYLDVWLNTTFEGPNATSITIDGFWDGGNIWKVRMSPNEVGLWNYTTYSNDEQLNNKIGSFNAIPSNNKGYIIRDPINRFAFKRSNGGNVLLMGDTNWNAMSDVNGSLNYLTYKQYVDNRSNQKFNFIRSYMVPFYSAANDSSHYNEGGRAFEPWDPDNLNPKYFQEVDKRINYANSKGIAVFLTIGGDEKIMTDFFETNNVKMERYIQYIAARFSAYNIAWEGRAEFEEQGSITSAVNQANMIGNSLEKYDPYGHIQSMHTIDSNNELGNEPWLDWIMHQSRDWSMIRKDRKYNKPILNEEFYYENSSAGATYNHHVNAEILRKGAWNVMMNGASGLAYGNTGTYNSRSQPFKGIEYSRSPGANYMTYLYNFWSNTHYWELNPNDIIVKKGIASAVVYPGNEYIFYLPNGGSIVLDLSTFNGTLNMEWFDPRTGNIEGKSMVQGGIRNFTSPDLNDWVLHLTSTQPAN